MIEQHIREAFWAKCLDCGHCWPVAYLPIDVSRFAKIAQRHAMCPMCGARGKKVVVAQQENGKLLEPMPDTGPKEETLR